MNRLVVPLALVVAALPLAACGGATQEDFAQEANAICSEFNAANETFSRQISTVEDAQASGRAIDAVTAASRRARERLVALEQPSGEDGATVRRFVDTSARVIDVGIPKLEALKAAFAEGDATALTAAAEALEQEPPENAESDRLAREIGATNCVS